MSNKMSEVTGAEIEVLRIVQQLWAVDAETIAAETRIPVSTVTDVCRSLIQRKFLAGSPSEYRLTPKQTRLYTKSSGVEDYSRENTEPATGEKQLYEERRVYGIGERIGEIKMWANPPSAEEVEATLKSNPQKTYEQAEAELTVHTLTCPAKGEEVSWHFCSTCPHQKGIDFNEWTVQCHYEFGEQQLPIIVKEDLFSYVLCPLVKQELSITYCERCRYHRGIVEKASSQNKEAKELIICRFPHTTKAKDEEGSGFEKLGKKLRIVPMRWE